MTMPVVVPPNPRKMLVELLRAHTQLPADLVGKVVATLPTTFPAGLPYLRVPRAAGGQTLVPLRLWSANVDVEVYAVDEDQADELARVVSALLRSLEQRASGDGGFTAMDVAEPFELPDPSGAKRVVIPLTATYRRRSA